MKMNRRTVLGVAGGAAVAAGAGLALAPRERPAPALSLPQAGPQAHNVLLVVTDQERAWDLLPPGFIERHCPARARLLRESLHFTQAHTPSAFCSMARSAIYTGSHPQRNGLWENIPLPYATNLHRDTPTLGTMFGAAGYHTAYFGKWHLSRLHDKKGAPFAPEQIRRELQSYGFAEVGTTRELDGPLGGFQDDGETAALCAAFLQAGERRERPWFAAVNLLNPHDIMYYTAGEAMTRTRRTRFPADLARPPQDPLYAQDLGYDLLPHYGRATLAGRPAAVQEYATTMELGLGELPFDDPQVAHEFQNYYFNCIRDADRALGQVLDALDTSAQAGRTVVVFVSDHGEMLGTHGLRGKGTVPYREGSRVPLLIRHPDGPRGTTSAALVSQLDIVPTLMGVAGVGADARASALPGLVGVDLAAVLADPRHDPRAGSDGLLLHWTSLAFQDHDALLAIARAREQGGPTPLTFLQAEVRAGALRRGQMRAVVDGRYKFARYFKPTEHHIPADWDALTARNDLELYDTVADPGETNNLARDPASARETLLAMNARLNRLIAREIGVDDGRFLPGPGWLWRGA